MRITHPELSFLWRLVAPYRPALLAATALLALDGLAVLAMPWLASAAVRSFVAGHVPFDLFAYWLGLVAAQCLLAFGSSIVLARTNARAVADLGLRIHDHAQSLPMRWHQDRSRGETLALLTNDVWRISGFLTGIAAPLLPLVLTCAGATLLLLWIEPAIGLAIALAVPVLVLALKLMTRSLRPLAEQGLQEDAAKYGMAEQHMSQLWLIKAFTREAEASARYRAQGQIVRDLEFRQARISAALVPTVRFAGATAVIALLWLGGSRLAAGQLGAAELVAIVLYGLLLIQPVSQLASVYGQLQLARGAARRLMAALEEAPEPDDGKLRSGRVRGEVGFEAIAFQYPGRSPLFRKLDLTITAGETVALTGANGSGKSTLAHLMLRFMDPQAGRLTLDGVDLREYALPHLREQIGIVSQSVMLLNATVGENIAYGRPGASRREIEGAARAANADGFIASLPDGYDTRIGDDGVRLSGGQRQRIALARALLKDPPVLILDEATAMFDPAAEIQLIDSSFELLRARTLVLITHRPASLALADRVLRLQDGQLQDITASLGPSPTTTTH